MKKSVIKGVLVATVAVVSVASGSLALASKPENPGNSGENGANKISICHRDNNVKKPYGPSRIEVDDSSIFKKNGHDSHQGPIATSEEVAQALKDEKIKWGDIIPPFEYEDDGQTMQYPGLNWTEVGQAMWENGCQFVEPEEPTMIEVCELESGDVVTIDEDEYNDTDYSKDLADCDDDTPEVPEVPETPETPGQILDSSSTQLPKELPKTGGFESLTGIVASILAVATAGASYAVRAITAKF